ncbi:esterase/lipase family protein [Leucobacter massiliensis]|uniref:Alpha/beta hydrolase n=1 Tax=Leucobacter massiliensis TaxID=1686285 RepID=A0A2S9QNV7_9MICO|nr:alpha/beta hydrolase [Leucobacter massiliensis]PRI11272.1 alpha/beta hydrolase [Leucobacter massiliensis]
MSGIRRAAWWALDYAYALWWQLRARVTRAVPTAFSDGDGTPVLVIPGVYESWRFLLPLIRELHGAGHPVLVVDPLGSNRVPVAEGARRVDAALAAAGAEEVVIVAHSKGGLVGKHVMAFGREAPRVRSMVAIASPFGGSRYARLLPGRTLRAFSPRDETLLRLATAAAVNARIVSVYAAFDPHIPEGSELPGARNVRLDTGGHFRILAHPRTLAEVRREVARAAREGTHQEEAS